jgi:hypothetical protein
MTNCILAQDFSDRRCGYSPPRAGDVNARPVSQPTARGSEPATSDTPAGGGRSPAAHRTCKYVRIVPTAEESEHSRFALSEELRQELTAHTYAARSCEVVLHPVVDPKPGSAPAQADALYAWEKASIWARSYLCAAAEHLCMWADATAPYKFHPEASNEIRLRPSLLLGRSGLEAAAHPVWLVEGTSPFIAPH